MTKFFFWRLAVLLVPLLSFSLYHQTKLLEQQTVRADLLYCQVIYQSLEHSTVEPTRNRMMLENTYFNNNCNEVLEWE